jgi:two-component system cell cycle sensor histidine kinase/response regulator CckA
MNKLMVVDDERIIAAQLEERLSMMGFEIVGIASSGDDAVNVARESRPDLVLMDIVMPGKLDGIQASEIIKGEMNIPVIFLTAYADDTLIEKAKLIEPYGYIVKPFQENELKAAIEVALYKNEKEQQVQERVFGMSKFMESATDAFFLFDSNLNCVDVNQTAQKLFYLDKNKTVGRNILEVSPVFMEYNIYPRCKEILQNEETYTAENAFWESRYGSWSLSWKAFKAGSFLGIVIMDDTGLLRNEDHVEKVQRIETFSIHIDNIVHKFDNLLSDILKNITFTKNKIKNKRRVYKRLLEAENASSEAKGIVKNLLTFSGNKISEMRISNAMDLISNSAHYFESNFDLKCDLNIPGDLWRVYADEEQIKTVITNIIIHSIHSMYGGVTVCISANNLVIDEANPLPLKKGNYIKIDITNTGEVVTRNDIGSLIDADYKSETKLDGLGFTFAHSIIKKHNGIITVEYELDAGTIYSIYLPASEESIASKKADNNITICVE